MKKIGIILVMAFMVFGMLGFAAAEEENTNTEKLNIAEAGSIGAFDKLMDNLRLSFTFNKERKVERALEIAEERLAEAEKLAEEGKFDEAEKARISYERLMDKSEKTLEGIDSDGNINQSEKTMRIMTRIQEKLEEHQEKLEEIRTRALEKRGENMTEEELIKFEELFSKLQEKSESISKKAIEKAAKVKTKHKVLAEMSDEEIEELEMEIESDEGLKKFREDRDERDEARFEREVKVREMNLDRWKERLENNENLTEEEISRISEKISKEEIKFEEFKMHKEELKEKLEELREIHKERFENKREFDKNLKEKLEEDFEDAVKKSGNQNSN